VRSVVVVPGDGESCGMPVLQYRYAASITGIVERKEDGLCVKTGIVVYLNNVRDMLFHIRPS